MKVDTFKCDVCGQQKQETNHWHRSTADGYGVDVRPWKSEITDDELHLCSDQCVLKTVQAWLDEQKKQSEVVDAVSRV